MSVELDGKGNATKMNELTPSPNDTGIPAASAVSEYPDSEINSGDGAGHLFYAVELLIFAIVGWGWLAVREYLGDTPTLDVVVMISIIVCSFINLTLALIITDSQTYAPVANAFFSHTVVLWVLYVYGLAESMRTDTSTLCCVDASGQQRQTYSIGPTYAAAYFGGLPLHQIPCMVTAAFLTVFVLIAGAQARKCTPVPRKWLVGGLDLCIVSLLITHLGMFLQGAPLCAKDSAAATLTWVLGIMSTILVAVDIDWFMGILWSNSRTDDQRRMHIFVQGLLRGLFVSFFSIYCLVIASVKTKSLSIALLLLLIFLTLACWTRVVIEIINVYGSDILGIKPRDFSLGAQSQRTIHLVGRSRLQSPFRRGQDMQVPDSMMSGRGRGDSNLLKKYPIFLQGQLNRGKKSY